MTFHCQLAATMYIATYCGGVRHASVNKSILPWCLCTGTMAEVQLNGLVRLWTLLNLSVPILPIFTATRMWLSAKIELKTTCRYIRAAFQFYCQHLEEMSQTWIEYSQQERSVFFPSPFLPLYLSPTFSFFQQGKGKITSLINNNQSQTPCKRKGQTGATLLQQQRCCVDTNMQSSSGSATQTVWMGLVSV